MPRLLFWRSYRRVRLVSGRSTFQPIRALMSDVVHGLARGLGRRGCLESTLPAGVARFAAGAGRFCGLTAPGEVLSKWLADDVYKSEKFRQALGRCRKSRSPKACAAQSK